MSLKRRYDGVQKARQEAMHRQQEETVKLAEQQREVAEMVKDGETTGDRVVDYAIVHWNGDEQAVECLKQLESELQGKIGQYILAVQTEREWHTTGQGGGFGPSGYEELRRRDISLGVLSDDNLVLDLDEGCFGFRTDGKYSWVDTRHQSGVYPGDMLFKKDDILYLPTVRKIVGGRGDLSILIGTDRVFDWLETGNGNSIDFSEDKLLSLALMFQAPDELPEQLAGLHREQVKTFLEDVTKAQGALEANRDLLFDIDQNTGLAEVANTMRNAIRDLKRLARRAVELKVDPTPILEHLARHAK